MKSKRLGLIGLGDMGLAMARCLLAAGYPVTGFDCGRNERRCWKRRAAQAQPVRRRSGAWRTSWS